MKNSLRLFSWLCALLPGLFLGACTQSQFVVVEPAEFARTIDLNHTFILRPPLDYELFEENQRLRVRGVNNTDQPIKVIGDESFLVDASGESHALRGQTIAPHSFISFTMPPRRPRGHGGSSIGFGVGGGGGSGHTFGGIGIGHDLDDDYYDRADDPPYYDWGRGDVRLHLAIEQNGNKQNQEFVLRREEKKK